MPTQLAQWLSQPFSSNMSAVRWFLFIGLLAVLLWGWRMVFAELAIVEGEIT